MNEQELDANTRLDRLGVFDDAAASADRSGRGHEPPVDDIAGPRGTHDTVAEGDAAPDERAPTARDTVPARSSARYRPRSLAGPLDDTIDSSSRPFDADGIERAPPATNDTPPTRSIGRLTIVRTLGAGGMGVVYAAFDPKLEREVAVKLIRAERDHGAARARLEREALALAKLAHPNIVTVYDVGVHDGQVWVSMELVHGRTLSRWLAEERPRWRQTLAVIKQAGRGIAAAHAEGLLHRDIKPENIMVGDDGRVRVMDFGLARAERSPARARAGALETSALDQALTIAGAIMGTPAYMAPEQFLGLAADERTDEFSLAVTLWEALYGLRPFAGDSIEALRAAVTSGTRSPVRSDRNVPTWLRRVLDRALEVDRNKRFESVRVMLDAIEQIERRRRARAVVAGLSLGLLVIAALGVAALWQWRAAESAQAELSAMVVALEERGRENQRALSVQRALRARSLIPADREVEALELATLAVGAYGPSWTRDPPAEATAALEHVLADDAAIVRAERRLDAHEGQVWTLAYSPDGSRLATAAWDRVARLWDTNSGALLMSLEGHGSVIYALAFSQDGSRLATASHDKTTRVWDTGSGALLSTLEGHERAVVEVEFSPDGAQLATSSEDGTARVWDARSGALLFALEGHADAITDLAYSPDGAQLTTASADRSARVWDARVGVLRLTLEGHDDRVNTVAYSPDGERVATASRDQTARIWSARSGELVLTLRGLPRNTDVIAYAPDGGHIAAAGADKLAGVWDARSGERVATLRGHENYLEAIEFSPDGERIATASHDKTARLWDARSGAHLATFKGHEGYLLDMSYSPYSTRTS